MFRTYRHELKMKTSALNMLTWTLHRLKIFKIENKKRLQIPKLQVGCGIFVESLESPKVYRRLVRQTWRFRRSGAAKICIASRFQEAYGPWGWNTRPRQVHAPKTRPLQLSNPNRFGLHRSDRCSASAPTFFIRGPLVSFKGDDSTILPPSATAPGARRTQCLSHCLLRLSHIQTHLKAAVELESCRLARFMFWMVIPPNFMSYQRSLWIAQLTLGLYRDMFYGWNRLPHSKGRSDWEQLTGCGFVEDDFWLFWVFPKHQRKQFQSDNPPNIWEGFISVFVVFGYLKRLFKIWGGTVFRPDHFFWWVAAWVKCSSNLLMAEILHQLIW